MKYLKYIVIVSILLTTISCKKDFLEVIDNTVLLQQGYVKDLETTGHFMNGVYVNLAANLLSWAYLPYPEIMADNMKPTSGTFFSQLYYWTMSPEGGSNANGDPIYMWREYYSYIRDCSYVIEKTDEYQSQNQEKANDLKGQALAIRALLHFTLVNMFAQSYNYTNDGSHIGIPLIKSSDREPAVTRQSVAEVYEGIIEDLNMALQLLPVNSSKKELINYQAAKALLARVYLFKEDFNNAKNLSRQVLTDVPIMTDGYPDKLYTAAETEALFRMPPGGSRPDGYTAIFIGRYTRNTIRYQATNDIASLLTKSQNDKRRNWVKAISSGWQITKFPVSAAGGQYPTPEGDYYQTLFRSTEMVLTAAEAYAKLNLEDSARFYIDVIRKRANPTLGNITANGPALLDSIYIERRKEMCFDGLRMFDLLRTKKGVQRMDALSPASQSLPYPSDKAIAPIPKFDVDLSNLQQNAGY